MTKRATALTGAAGEHYVAYKLSAFGYPVALTRGGSPTIDLMVGDLSGEATVSVQVKTTDWARRDYKRAKNKDRNHWEWDVGRKALTLVGASIFYAFVDLKGTPSDDYNPHPDVFIVPSRVVASFVGEDWKRYRYWIFESERTKYYEAWHLLTQRLARKP